MRLYPLLLTLLLAPACSVSNTEGNTNNGEKISESLAVVSSDPADGATDVTMRTKVRAVFSHGIEKATLTAESFRLTSAGGTEVAGDLSYDPDTLTATLTPGEQLDPETEYTVTISTDIAGLVGSLEEAVTFSFSTASALAPTIEFQSHADGRIYGSRSITLKGVVSTDVAIDSLTATVNGNAATVTESEGIFEFGVTLADGANAIKVDVVDSAGQSASASLGLIYPFLTFTNGQSASAFIGQPDFTSSSRNAGGSATASTLSAPWGDPLIHNGILYVPDYGNSRVLGFYSTPATNGVPADFVLGQADFTSAAVASGQSGLSTPADVAFGGGKFAISDQGNNRILIYNSAPTTTGTLPSVVVGQANFNDNADSCTAAGLQEPDGIALVDGKLIVADYSNHRVLIWNSVPASHGVAADLVLGQSNFTSCGFNRYNADATASSMHTPSGVWSDGKRLLVADANNYRILVWNSFPTTNGQAADFVLGQPDLTSREYPAGPTAAAIGWAYKIDSNGNQIFFSDGDWSRVLVWNGFPSSNMPSADQVLGQSDFVSDIGIGVDGAVFDYPGGLLVTDDGLFISDYSYHRTGIYRPE